MKLYKELKGGSLSKTEVLIDQNVKFVRKSISSNRDREYGLVRWHSQIRKLQVLNMFLPENTIPILKMGTNKSNYFYDMPYLDESENLFTALANGLSTNMLCGEVYKLLKTMQNIKMKSVRSSLSVYLSEEIFLPLLKAIQVIESSNFGLDNSEYKIVKDYLKISKKFIIDIQDKYGDIEIDESLTHGNFTLENALWDYSNNSIVLIDPYAETYCETILGDLSQLLQSSASGYEYISKNFNESKNSIINYPINILPLYLKDFSDELISCVSNEKWYSPDLTQLLRASQFTRMFPFKLVNNPRQGLLFMLHGLKLLNKLSL